MIDSPFLEQDPFEEEPFEIEDYVVLEPSDSVQMVKRRMLLILGVVSLVTATLGMLTLPATGQSVPISVDNRYIDGEESFNAVPETDVQEALGLAEGQGTIANLFTPEVQYWESKIVSWAAEHGVDPNAVATIMQIESCGDPQAESVAGAQGLFQVMPFHFSTGEDMLDPDTNALRGMNFFNEQLRYTDGDVFLSFAGYNGGYAASGGNYANWANETQRYYGWAKGIYEDAAAGEERSETLETWLAAGGAAGCQRAAERLGLN
ncbi:MAG: transglycosylase SLT domain-containing protein [Candidatus Promineifilaceae bacterium]|nr:transglycosylase SLT domain-containing protein [Candidatus Promineifilaceae bacterium]